MKTKHSIRISYFSGSILKHVTIIVGRSRPDLLISVERLLFPVRKLTNVQIKALIQVFGKPISEVVRSITIRIAGQVHNLIPVFATFGNTKANLEYIYS